MYDIFETQEFIKSIERLPSRDAAFVTQKLEEYVYPQLRERPHYGANIKKLKAYSPDTWRYRIGRYRIFYVIDEDDQVVLLLTADQRKNSYR